MEFVERRKMSDEDRGSGSIKRYRDANEAKYVELAARRSTYEFYSVSSITSTKFKWKDLFRTKAKSMYSKDDLHDCVLRLHKYCLTHLLDSYRVHLNRLKGVQYLNELVKRVYFDDLRISQVVRVIWCAISIVHHFHIRLRVGAGLTKWSRRRQAGQAYKSFDGLMKLLLPELYCTVIHSIVTFFEEAHLWSTELLCTDILDRVLKISKETLRGVNVLLDVVEQSSAEVARKVMRIIYGLLEKNTWENINADLLNRFLNLYKDSLFPDDDDDISYMTQGMEVCLRRLFERIGMANLHKAIDVMLDWPLANEFSGESLLDFGNVIEYAAVLYASASYYECFPPPTISRLLTLIESDQVVMSLLGNRILQHMLDRLGNRAAFDVPRIFFQNTHFNIKLGAFDTYDKEFLRQNREAIHNALLVAMKKHGIQSRINLESIYCTVSLLVVEIPCGFAAAAVACLMMAVQEATIAAAGVDLECTNRVHAIIMSVMSLICWVHDAKVFYDYLNTILYRRADMAPRLNPPLKIIYSYARHHVLWNKPELFFEDWEVRYGLWKCFRTARGSGPALPGASESDAAAGGGGAPAAARDSATAPSPRESATAAQARDSPSAQRAQESAGNVRADEFPK